MGSPVDTLKRESGWLVGSKGGAPDYAGGVLCGSVGLITGSLANTLMCGSHAVLLHGRIGFAMGSG